MVIRTVSMFWPTPLGLCLRGHPLLWDSTEARTVLFIPARSCQVLVNGFCLGLRRMACQAWACSVQQRLWMHFSLLHDGDMTHGSLSRTLTAPKYHSVFVQITWPHCFSFSCQRAPRACLFIFLDVWTVCYRPRRVLLWIKSGKTLKLSLGKQNYSL